MNDQRMRPLARNEWPEQMADALAAMTPPTPRHEVPPPGGRPGKPKASGVLGVFALHPDLAQTWLRFNGHILFGTTLTLRQRELLVLRVAAVLEAPYEWSSHLVHKDEAGITDEDIARIAFGPRAPLLDPLEQAMLSAVDELESEGTISEATWSTLAHDLDDKQILDLMFTVGCYTMLCWLSRSIGLPLERDQPGTAQP